MVTVGLDPAWCEMPALVWRVLGSLGGPFHALGEMPDRLDAIRFADGLQRDGWAVRVERGVPRGDARLERYA